jgi:hypothetical protein
MELGKRKRKISISMGILATGGDAKASAERLERGSPGT